MCRYGRVTSHLFDCVLCLYIDLVLGDDGVMETTQHIYQHICHKCDRPALTFDENEHPLCGRQATLFIAMPRVDTKDDEYWIPVVVEASI